MDDVFRALQTPRRREILRLVWDQERSAGEIHRAMTDVSFGAVSQHLRVLQLSGAARCRHQGRQRFYRACPAALGPLRQWLEQMWDSALYELKLQAELDAARRGPQAAEKQTAGRPAKIKSN